MNLKDSKLTKEQNVKAIDLIEEHHNTFKFMWWNRHLPIYNQGKAKTGYRKWKWITWKNWGLLRKNLQDTVLLYYHWKRTPEFVQSMYWHLSSQCQIGQIQSCISTCLRLHTGHRLSLCEVMSKADFRDAYHELNIKATEILLNNIILWITHFHLTQGVGLNVSPAI